MARRDSIAVTGFAHRSPIPAASRIGNLLMTSLVTGTDAQSRILPADFAAQAANMFGHVRAILAAAGGTPAQIIKMTIWVNDRALRTQLAPAWEEMFPDPASRPARVTLNRDLGDGKLVECEVIAVLEN